VTLSRRRWDFIHYDAEGIFEVLTEADTSSVWAAAHRHLPTLAIVAVAMMQCHRPNRHDNCPSCVCPRQWWQWRAKPQRTPCAMGRVHDVVTATSWAILAGHPGGPIPERYSTDR